MQTINKFNQMASSSMIDMGQILKTACLSNASELNCVRIGIVEEFYPEDLTVQVRIANKRTIGMNEDGTPRVRDFAPIYAKICYCNPFITNPVKKGDECVLLFSDREIESWFINGDVNPDSHTRMHDLTDAIAIFGIRSLPKMIDIVADCLHLTHPTKVLADNFHASNGASGNIIDSDGKVLATVVDGIITEIF